VAQPVLPVQLQELVQVWSVTQSEADCALPNTAEPFSFPAGHAVQTALAAVPLELGADW
jgi:hypothetical protein